MARSPFDGWSDDALWIVCGVAATLFVAALAWWRL